MLFYQGKAYCEIITIAKANIFEGLANAKS